MVFSRDRKPPERRLKRMGKFSHLLSSAGLGERTYINSLHLLSAHPYQASFC